MKAKFKRAVPYAKDTMNLPVADVEAAIPFYEQTMGFRVLQREDSPHRRAVLARNDIQIGLQRTAATPHRKDVTSKSTTSKPRSRKSKAESQRGLTLKYKPGDSRRRECSSSSLLMVSVTCSASR